MTHQTEAGQAVTDSVSKVNEEVAVGEDLDFQRRWWRFENGIWVFFCLLIVLDLAGAFGRGPLAHAQASAADGSMTIKYERIERTSTPSILTVHLQQSAIHDGVAQLFVSNSLQEELGAQRVIPSPKVSQIGPDGLLYTFPVTSSPASVEFAMEPTGPGVRHLTLQVPGAAPVSLTIFVVP